MSVTNGARSENAGTVENAVYESSIDRLAIGQPPLLESTVLRPASSATVREQRDGYLVYSTLTDELHIVPPLGMYVFQLCDGSRRVADIELLVADALETEPELVRDQVRAFIRRLVARKILEPVPTTGALQ